MTATNPKLRLTAILLVALMPLVAACGDPDPTPSTQGAAGDKATTTTTSDDEPSTLESETSTTEASKSDTTTETTAGTSSSPDAAAFCTAMDSFGGAADPSDAAGAAARLHDIAEKLRSTAPAEIAPEASRLADAFDALASSATGDFSGAGEFGQIYAKNGADLAKITQWMVTNCTGM